MNQSRNQTHAEARGRHVILVIDDDFAVRNSLKFTLEVEGFEVRTYPAADDLLNEDSLPPCSCLVTDYYMPMMNGMELVTRLRDLQISIPAILITSLPSENLRKRAAAAGVLIVEKPLLGSDLLDAIRKAFDGHAIPS
jgi:two-component system, LuxR family, response regulator FixJ